MFRRGRSNALKHHRLRLLAATLATIVALAGMTPAVAAPDEDLVIELHYLEADPTQLTICTRDTVQIAVRAVLSVKRFTSASHFLGAYFGGGGQFITRGPVGGQPIFASVGNPSVGSVSPTGRMTSMTTSPIGWSQFTFKAKDQPGTTEVRFHQGGNGPYGDVNVDIEVKQCKYQIETLGEWHFGWGFQPWATEHIIADVTPDRDGSFDVLVPVLNEVHFTVPFGCAIGANAAGSKARLQGSVIDGYINFSVEFDPVPGSAFVTCPLVADTNKDKGFPERFTTRPLQVVLRTNIQRPATTTVAQDVEANGTWPGTTEITVTTIPQ